MIPEILIATQNAGKVRELKELLAGSAISVKSLSDFEDIAEPEETGLTFAENAALKASYYAEKTASWILADDSGLEVAALNNAPGVFSARYAGRGASDKDRIEKLLDELNQTQNENRAARFVCAMAIAGKDGAIKYLAEGICQGRIALTPKGTNGFGYDSIFIPDGFEESFGALSGDIKQEISHRAQATAKIIRFLRDFTAT